mgnify:CR=1 FL=1
METEQELHEKIRVHSMAAGKVVKEEGKANDLLERIAADPAFGMNMEQLQAIMKPETRRTCTTADRRICE